MCDTYIIEAISVIICKYWDQILLLHNNFVRIEEFL
jgi:hypothetical protein